MEYLFYAVAIIMVLLLCSMALFAYLATRFRDIQSRKRLDAIDKSSQYRKQKPIKPNNDFKSKDRGLEKRQQEQEKNGVAKYNPDGQDLDIIKNQDVIVGVAESVGPWTAFIQKQKIGFMVALGALQGNKKGRWENLIKAQAASQGKGQDRGR